MTNTLADLITELRTRAKIRAMHNDDTDSAMMTRAADALQVLSKSKDEREDERNLICKFLKGWHGSDSLIPCRSGQGAPAMIASLLFVGESPPPGSPPDFVPFDCPSGTRLAALLGLRDRATLLRCVSMLNLFAVPTGVPGGATWHDDEAKVAARDLVIERRSIIALGRRVADAFDMPSVDAKSRTPAPPLLTAWRHALGPLVTYAPHPSGASTVLNAPEVRQSVRHALVAELVLGCPALRPWDFRLDDAQVLAALAAAVSPHAPQVGAAAVTWAVAQRQAREARTATPLLARVAMQGLGPAVAGAARDDAYPAPAWDCPLREVLAALLAPDGARTLAARWAPHAAVPLRNVGDKWLLRRAEDFTAQVCAVPMHVLRATCLRYAMEPM